VIAMDLGAAFQRFFENTGVMLILEDPLYLVFIIIGFILLYLAIRKRIEPLLLAGIGVGMILANIPGAHLMTPGTIMGLETGGPSGAEAAAGPLFVIYKLLIETEIIPLLIFLCLGAMTDFRPLIAQPYTFILGAAAQLGVVIALLGALFMGFTLNEAASIGIIGGADGPTTIYTAVKLAPHILGPVALAAYTYMALVPIIQPPIIRLLPKKQRAVRMKPPRKVSDLEALLFPVMLVVVTPLLVPKATPIIGMIALGNILKESGVTELVERLAKTSANELMNILIILLTVTVGSTMSVDMINYYSKTMGITREEFLLRFSLTFLWGLMAFITSTIGGVIFGEIMYIATKGKVNPAIGAAGVSAVPMAARVVQREVSRVDPGNYIIMNAMGPNVAGVIGTAIVAGIYIDFVQLYTAGAP
jgi:oxaloacetate decarboxylase beta subunit